MLQIEANFMIVNFYCKSVKMFIVQVTGADPLKLFVINLDTLFCKLDYFIIRIISCLLPGGSMGPG
jgi:hypothetical protein